MKKIDLNSDSKANLKFIEDLKKLMPEYDINVFNCNSFKRVYDEKNNCKNCKNINECKNLDNRCQYIYEDGSFILKQCDKSIKEDELNRKNSLIKTFYLPKKVLEADINDFDLISDSRKKIYNFTQDFILSIKNNEYHEGLYIYGGFSKGKTFALSMISKEIAKAGKKVLLIYFPDLVSDLKGAMNTGRYDEVLNMLKTVDVLMLDDFGAENITPWLRDEVISPVINYRLQDEKPTFISSNLDENELISHLAITKNSSDMIKSKRIVSRIFALANYISLDDTKKIYQR